MSDISRVLLILASCVFTQNVVFVRMFADSGLFCRDRRVCAAAWLGLATALVMTMTSLVGWLVRDLVLVPMGAEYLSVIALVLIAAVLAWLVALCLGKAKPALAESLSDGLPFLMANCAVLGVALINVEKGCGLGESVLNGLFGGLGFLLAIVLMAGVQERLESSRVPKSLRGLPISLISASMIALAFMGFMGLGK